MSEGGKINATSITKDFSATLPLLSVTLIIKTKLPNPDGIPLNTPSEDKLIPAGSWPATTSHNKGAVPETASSFCSKYSPNLTVGRDSVLIVNFLHLPCSPAKKIARIPSADKARW